MRGFLRYVEREATVYRRLLRGMVLYNFVAPGLTLAAMGLGLGQLVDNGAGLEGQRYLDFVVPGLLGAQVFQVSAGDGLWPVMAGHRWVGFFKAAVSSPLTPFDVLAGTVAFNVLRAGLISACFLTVATLLGGVHSPWAVTAVPVGALVAASVNAPLAAFSASQDDDAAFLPIMRMLVIPITLFSGTFFPVSQLPGAVRALVPLSPLWHGVELLRVAVTGRGDPAAAVGHTAVLVGFTAVGLLVGRTTITKRLAS